MKRAFFIITILLPLLLNYNTVSSSEIHNDGECDLKISDSHNSNRNSSIFSALYHSYAKAVGSLQEDDTYSSTVRSYKTGRRIQLTAKSTCRIIKDGRVIDRFNFYTYQHHLLQFLSGRHSIQRYIFIICQLLI